MFVPGGVFNIVLSSFWLFVVAGLLYVGMGTRDSSSCGADEFLYVGLGTRISSAYLDVVEEW